MVIINNEKIEIHKKIQGIENELQYYKNFYNENKVTPLIL